MTRHVFLDAALLTRRRSVPIEPLVQGGQGRDGLELMDAAHVILSLAALWSHHMSTAESMLRHVEHLTCWLFDQREASEVSGCYHIPDHRADLAHSLREYADDLGIELSHESLLDYLDQIEGGVYELLRQDADRRDRDEAERAMRLDGHPNHF